MTIASATMTDEPPAASNRTDDAVAGRLRAMFEEHHRLVFHTACRVTGNAEDAEDVVQTIFLRLLKRLPRQMESATAGGYLRRAAINASLDLLRSRRRSRLVALDGKLLEDLEPAVDAASSPDRRLAGRELRARLRRELAKANPRAAEMFVLRYFEGYRNIEIGELLGTSRMTVAVTLHRLRRQLAGALADEAVPALAEAPRNDDRNSSEQDRTGRIE